MPGRGRPKKISDARVVELHNEGINDTSIARKTGVSRSTVSRRRAKLGLDRNYEYSNLSLKEKIIFTLHKRPMSSTGLLRSINNRGKEYHHKNEVYQKLLELKEMEVIQRHFNGKNSWPNSIWTLFSPWDDEVQI